ncbi:MAG: peptidylprolyl isomerase [Hyphomicrobiales bacterium]|nr:peptidylprolyl isomerase [Hyphomicrobiales bacterium]
MTILKAIAKSDTKPVYSVIIAGFAISMLVFTVGCVKSTEAVDSNASDPNSKVVNAPGVLQEKKELDAIEDESGARIIRQKSNLRKKGTNIVVLVNRQPITNYDIRRRVAFLKLRRIGGNRTKKATDELIEEKIKYQEAVKRSTLVSDAVVNRAFAGFAKRNKTNTSTMSRVLGQSGVTAKHFKEFLRIQISWQQTVGSKFQNQSSNVSEADALFSIRKSGDSKPETREFMLQQIIFVVPAAKRKKLLRQRVAEAKAFSQQFTACDSTMTQIKNLHDVALKNLGRIMEPELPLDWRDAITGTEAGKTTRVKETPKGAEIIAVCSVRNVSDDKAAQLVTQTKEFSSLSTKGNAASDKYLLELRKQATIIYR